MLVGELAEFALGDVLHLLAGRGRSGRLEIEHEGRSGRVELAEGRVRTATADRRRAGLARRLVGTGAIDVGTLTRLLEREGRPLSDLALAELLVRGDHLGAGQVASALREQTIDAVTELSALSQGRFRFEREHSGAPAAVAMPLDQLFTEVEARIAARPELLQRVGGAEVIYAPAVPDVDEARLSAATWQLLTLVDGRRSVGELVVLRGSGPDDTYQRLAELVTVGLIAPLTEDARPPAVALAQAQEQLAAIEARWQDADAGLDATWVPATPEPEEPAVAPVAVSTTPPAPDRTVTPLKDRASSGRLRPDPGVDRAMLERLIAGIEALP